MTPAPLPAAFVRLPLAHRGYHDAGAGRPENSFAAARAAIAAGYGIECDIQPSRDGVPMVFHDYDMQRLTGQPGPIQQQGAAELAATPLIGGQDGIPTLAEFLALVGGRVPLLIEVKDQDGAMGPAVGALERAVAQVCRGYPGPLALMSFNPHSVAALAKAAPELPRGLTTEAWEDGDAQMIPAARRAKLREIGDLDGTGAGFISHDVNDLDNPRVRALKAAGLPILCWTIRSDVQEQRARQIADNITFEGYAPAIPGA